MIINIHILTLILRNDLFKKLSYTIYKILYFIDSLLNSIFKRRFLIWFNEFIQNDSYVNVKVLDQKILFFCPNQITRWRVETLFTKEPETIEWIDTFKENNEKIIFWDIGGNIGLYSIYAALKHRNIQVISFEPSTSNLRILSRNISINKLEDKIIIHQMPLTNVSNQYLMMEESEFTEGWAMNTFGAGIDFEGKPMKAKNKYKILGTSINYLINNKILPIPHYIKIDVDGIEELILDGASEYLFRPEIKSISIEINQDFKTQHTKILEIMKNAKFVLKHKKHAESMKYSKFSNFYNFIFDKKI